MRNIATYFVQSNHGDYPIKNNDAFSVGKLTKVEPELKFTAKFDFDDILAAYNAMDGIHAISRNELIAIMAEKGYNHLDEFRGRLQTLA